jgi:dTDP-4-dehydrorhamnose 3,5-epimerase
MRFTECEVAGVWLVELEPHTDARGFFARTFCTDEFAAHSLDPAIAQCNVSYSRAAGTIRGLHYQVAPAAETKLVRVTRGAIYDVAVDLRPESPTYRQHVARRLDDQDRAALYVPTGCAHGFQTLVDGTEVEYQMGAPYTPGTDRGIRYNDPALAIDWPLPVTEISDRDANWPLLPL